MNISYEYKIGVKREIISALRKVFGPAYPDPDLAGRVMVVEEYPQQEVRYPLIIVRVQPQEAQNIGVGHYELDYNDQGVLGKVLHWKFHAEVIFEVYALAPYDRDRLIVGLVNLIAFDSHIPAFKDFHDEIADYDFAAIQLITDHFQEGGDSVVSVPWSDDERPVFMDTISLDLFGEFFTDNETGNLIEIDRVIMYPYKQGQAIPQGSQATSGTPGTPDYKDNRTVPWT